MNTDSSNANEWEGSWEDTKDVIIFKIPRFLCDAPEEASLGSCSNDPIEDCIWMSLWDPVCCAGETMSNMGHAGCQGCTEDDCTLRECGKFARSPMLNVLDLAASPEHFVLDWSYISSHWVAGLLLLAVALLAMNLCRFSLTRKKKYVAVRYDDSEDCTYNEAKPMNDV